MDLLHPLKRDSTYAQITYKSCLKMRRFKKFLNDFKRIDDKNVTLSVLGGALKALVLSVLFLLPMTLFAETTANKDPNLIPGFSDQQNMQANSDYFIGNNPQPENAVTAIEAIMSALKQTPTAVTGQAKVSKGSGICESLSGKGSCVQKGRKNSAYNSGDDPNSDIAQ